MILEGLQLAAHKLHASPHLVGAFAVRVFWYLRQNVELQNESRDSVKFRFSRDSVTSRAVVGGIFLEVAQCQNLRVAWWCLSNGQ